jgi:hypothetical protein
MTNPAIIEAAEVALDLNVEDISTWEIERTALAVLAAVTPLIRAAALEEAAVVAEKDVYPSNWAIAAAIRALKEQP